LTNQGVCVRIDEHSNENGPVAQLGARFHGMEEVVGSIPTRSTNLSITWATSPRVRRSLFASGPFFSRTPY
jgi:hypothetical protein